MLILMCPPSKKTPPIYFVCAWTLDIHLYSLTVYYGKTVAKNELDDVNVLNTDRRSSKKYISN